jgi:hypothetical protein
VSLVGTGRWPSRGHCCGADIRIRSTAYVTLRGQRFLHHHVAAYADRGENHDPTRATHCSSRIEREGLTGEPAIREQCPLATRSMLHALIGQETDVLAVSRRPTDEPGVVEIVLRIKAPPDGPHTSTLSSGQSPSAASADVRVPKVRWRFAEL